MTQFTGFPADTFKFLNALTKNNNRDWFQENKSRYESSFLNPSLEFIQSMQQPLSKIAPMLKVEAKKVGGSLMRIYKDTRFSKDKTPYKTNIGIHFRHQAGKDVHAPGVYLHIDPKECFLGAGIWMPASDALRAIRNHIADNPQEWKKTKKNRAFSTHFTLHADRLKTAPRGFAKDHPEIEDLRLKSFIGIANLDRGTIQSEVLVQAIPKLVKSSRHLMEFLCEALGQPY